MNNGHHNEEKSKKHTCGHLYSYQEVSLKNGNLQPGEIGILSD